jgi:glycosyltransferase involved in cell wall biosynthesis
MPLISIIIPVYNVEKYLSECLDSIMNQTFSDIEIICINDGSTDNSLAYLEKYSQKGSRVIVINQENKGQAVARNIGIKAAKGKYVLFVDSDDWIAQNSCETLLSYLTEDIDLIIFDTNIFGEFDKSMNKYFQPKFSGKLNISGDVILKTPTSPWNKIYR